jgi:cytochrome c
MTTTQKTVILGCLAFILSGHALPAAAADPEAGGRVFKIQCSACHGVVEGRKGIGPSLFGVVGRKAGTVPDFHYSEANKGSGLTWNEATLDRYLANPRAVVPGTTMPYAGLKNDTQRADLIAYLATLK